MLAVHNYKAADIVHEIVANAAIALPAWLLRGLQPH